MIKKKLNEIFKQVLDEIKLNEKETKEINNETQKFVEKLQSKISELKINSEVFVGGSVAKGTLIKKDKYDADIFLRFDKKYSEKELPKLTKKILNKIKSRLKIKKIHGSRDYFTIQKTPKLFFEIIPVKKISKNEKIQNITDLSYLHVNYINKKTKTKKLLDEIKITKAFVRGCNCYGAESYIQGFSGYAIELLVIYYKTFEKFLKAMKKIKPETKNKKILDIEKDYKNPSEILIEMNKSKLDSPFVLIDPTYKKRNVVAALSKETFIRFQEEIEKFLKNPSKEFFYKKRINIKKAKKDCVKNSQFIVIKITTPKQEGDIAGTKLLKFYKHLKKEISRYFDIENSEFEYQEKKSGIFFLCVKPKKEILFIGPQINNKIHSDKFKKIHKKYFIKNNRLHSIEIPQQNIKKFLINWKNKKSNKRKIKEMNIKNIRIIE